MYSAVLGLIPQASELQDKTIKPITAGKKGEKKMRKKERKK